MNITEIRIFDHVCEKTTKYPMRVLGIYADTQDLDQSEILLDFPGNQGDPIACRLCDIEPCAPPDDDIHPCDPKFYDLDA